MKNDATVASCLLAGKTLIGRVDWSVQPPVGATDVQKQRAKFIESCMNDMDHTWEVLLQKFLVIWSTVLTFTKKCLDDAYVQMVLVTTMD